MAPTMLGPKNHLASLCSWNRKEIIGESTLGEHEQCLYRALKAEGKLFIRVRNEIWSSKI